MWGALASSTESEGTEVENAAQPKQDNEEPSGGGGGCIHCRYKKSTSIHNRIHQEEFETTRKGEEIESPTNEIRVRVSQAPDFTQIGYQPAKI